MNHTGYHIFKLSNGLRCVHSRNVGVVSYIGVAVNVGSRDENADSHGLAHFVEHTIFKGTRHRSSWHISNRMESVGGELNAYTSKEETVVYTASPAGEPSRALELIADLVKYSIFPADEVEREREVVCEEIKSYLDSPADSVYDDFEELVYSGSSMAHNILGTEQSVRDLGSAKCRDFIEDFYTPDNMTLYIADPCSEGTAERLAEKYFDNLRLHRAPSTRRVPPVAERFSSVVDRNGFQAHTLVGARTCSRIAPERFALFLLNNYLGGPCMNSRLNRELRERRGYVYTVESSLALMSDCGLMMIYFGSDKQHVEQCKRIIRRELENLAETPISSVKFDRIRRQYCGQLQLSTDNRESVAMALGKSLLYYDEVHDSLWTREQIMSVTAEEVRAMAESLLQNGLSELTLC